MDCPLPGSSVFGVCQARVLEWAAISFSRGSSRPRDGTCTSCIGRRILYHWTTWEAPRYMYILFLLGWAVQVGGSPLVMQCCISYMPHAHSHAHCCVSLLMLSISLGVIYGKKKASLAVSTPSREKAGKGWLNLPESHQGKPLERRGLLLKGPWEVRSSPSGDMWKGLPRQRRKPGEKAVNSAKVHL